MNQDKKRILIVDDNVDIHEDFKKILNPVVRVKNPEMLDLENELFGNISKKDSTSTGYLIDDAYQGEEALVMVDRAQNDGNPYSLVFMDVRMPPGIDGIETTYRLWQKYPYLEIVVCTAYSDYSWEQMLEKLGRNDHLLFIKKPFDGVSVKQIALALTTKWELSLKEREHLIHLEAEVERRTEKIRAIMQNLSELKDQAEAATKAKSAFLSNMSHEIRTPINAIVGFGELLKATSLTVEQRDYVETISSSGEHLLALMNEILDISKIESQKVVLEEINFDLENLISNVLKMLQMRIFGKPVDLNLVFPSDVPRYFRGDPTRIRQIFMNLVGNAIKFTDKGEVTVIVSIDPDGICGKKGKVTLKCSVKDTGIGIPADKQKEIFKIFTQVDSSITRKYGGSGLGLNITEALVQMMDGEIRVESVFGKGSEFVFYICLKPGQQVLDKDISHVDFKLLRHKKVIIVDDNDQARQILENYCTQIELDIVYSTHSAEKALEWLIESGLKVDLILSDIIMPEMDGCEFSHRLRQMELTKNIKLVALTSDALPGIAERINDAGFDALVAKPVLRNNLYEMLQVVFSHDRKERKEVITMQMVHELINKEFSALLVEDNTLNQKLMSIMLKQMGCSHEIANNGSEAIDMLRVKSYDIILMDVQMPVMDGYEATKIIRGEMKITTPIVALTAYVFTEEIQKCKDMGMNDFIPKPFEEKKLRETIRKWVNL
jgi:signal transduction histidine kinase/PleD family two-component response regulator